MKKIFIVSLTAILNFTIVSGQRVCESDDYNKDLLKEYPELSGRVGRTNADQNISQKLFLLKGIINIPVVVHVVYNNPEENVSDAEIQSQIKVLNLDFSAQNTDINKVPVNFKKDIANCEIKFDLKKITRTKTTKDIFFIDTRGVKSPSKEQIKFSNKKPNGVEDGGINGYSCTEYLNIWVGNITNGSSSQLLGYATFPGGLCEYDGVVIYYKVLGTLNSISPFNKGRTLTHEVGHYLNLIHIGGDRINGCGDDLCMDTPPQKGGNDGGEFGQNFGSPRHPHKAINECQGTNEEMFMNYMDYVNDSAMVFFTNDQKKRIRSLFIEGGDRSYFIYNNSENKAGFITERNRSDAYTPAITDFKKYFHCKPITDTCKYAFVFWTKIEEAKEYKVFAKKIKSDNWEVINTSNTYIKIGGLNSHILYEIKVQAILSNKLSSSESIPYVFSLKGSSFLKLKKLVLIE